LENKHLNNRIKRLENELYELKNPNIINHSNLSAHKMNSILKEADDAMDRFNAKLRKETAKYAKQKQSKG
tara:strand:+ start:1196 stop:1405 length:210 start_codon:yes stop_codon:yes gene_type:complete